MRIFKNRRTTLLLMIDATVFAAVFALIMLVNFILEVKQRYTQIAFLNLLIGLGAFFAVRIAMGIYSNVWRYANTRAYFNMVVADAVSGIATLLFTFFVPGLFYGVWEIVGLFSMACVATLVTRFMYQVLYRRLETDPQNTSDAPAADKINIAIVGAGQTGSMLAEELKLSAHSAYRPVCFIDSDPCKVGGTVSGIKVYSSESAIKTIERLGVTEVIIALPGKKGEAQKAIVDYYGSAGVTVKIYDFPIGKHTDASSKRVVREIGIEDLLFRERIDVVDTDAADFYLNKTVLVTGGGGSIGSELCRQIARLKPAHLIILDIYENNAYEIQQELTRLWGASLKLSVEIASVRDRERLDAIFEYYKPQIVFHAAAHKHVPLMEHSNCEAIKNNIFGTKNTADIAEKHGVEKFILISTDKAVNPTNVMGATKRMCEMVIGCRKDSATAFAAVRFGNVLGSNGSVVPLFKRQIAEGGPLTITDRRVVRYFMTIPEAAGLVVEAGAMAKRGTLFVLDMGDPVKIIGLAETMIKLSGFEPYKDIDIVEIGLRPGEKLYEELLMKCEDLTKTENDLIFIEEDAPLSRDEVDEKLRILREVVLEEQGKIASERITAALKSVVPTFKSPEEINSTAERSEEMMSAKG